MATIFTRNWGNSENNGSTELLAKKSIQSALDVAAASDTINFAGWYREYLSISGNKNITGQGEGIIDAAKSASTILFGGLQSGAGNISFVNVRNVLNLLPNVMTNTLDKSITDSCFYDIGTIIGYSTVSSSADWRTTRIFVRCLLAKVTLMSTCILGDNTTVDNCAEYRYFGPSNTIRTEWTGSKKHIIFNNTNIIAYFRLPYSYSLFRNCAFMFALPGGANNETVATYPVGANDDEKLLNLQQRCANVYGGNASSFFIGCKYQTNGDLFVDLANQNYHLVPGCLATRISDVGNYVGKYPEWSGDVIANATLTNINAADGVIIDELLNAYAVTPIKDLGRIRKLGAPVITGQADATAGDQFNADSDQGPAVYPGTAMENGQVYVVYGASIVQTTASKARTVGTTFTANTTDGLDFTSSGGYVKNVIVANTPCVEVKLARVSASTNHTELEAEFALLPWLKMDLSVAMKAVHDANGKPILGNRDTGYASGTDVYARYYQIRTTVNANNVRG